jgi:tRNA(fMet)-specific endonuclease VapC
MSGRVLLDTNIIIALFASDNSVIDHLKAISEVFVPSIAVGELFYGARKSSRVEENIKKIESFVGASSVLSCDLETARQYGMVKEFLRGKGRPIPENDIWIAALAVQYDLTLISRDSHFEGIEGLSLATW